MAMAKSVMIFMTVMAFFGEAAMAAVYNVGDVAGWTTISIIDYKKWADRKTFHVGETLVFKYNPQIHNVKQVNQADFESCNGKSPIASYASGSDSITLKEPGHAYFLCGYAGHCQVGQKVDIMVHPTSTSPTESPSGSPTSSPSPNSTLKSISQKTTVAPSQSTAPFLYSSNFWLVSGMVAFCLTSFGF